MWNLLTALPRKGCRWRFRLFPIEICVHEFFNENYFYMSGVPKDIYWYSLQFFFSIELKLLFCTF